MSDDKIPQEVKKLIKTHVRTVAHLELLLFLYENRERPWTPEELSTHLRTNTTSIQTQLQELKTLVFTPDEKSNVFQFCQSNPQNTALVSRLAKVKQEYPYRLIDEIYSYPYEKIKTLADAFQFSKKKD